MGTDYGSGNGQSGPPMNIFGLSNPKVLTMKGLWMYGGNKKNVFIQSPQFQAQHLLRWYATSETVIAGRLDFQSGGSCLYLKYLIWSFI